jgi:hypothetical protein
VKYDKLLQPMEMKLGKLRGYHVRWRQQAASSVPMAEDGEPIFWSTEWGLWNGQILFGWQLQLAEWNSLMWLDLGLRFRLSAPFTMVVEKMGCFVLRLLAMPTTARHHCRAAEGNG